MEGFGALPLLTSIVFVCTGLAGLGCGGFRLWKDRPGVLDPASCISHSMGGYIALMTYGVSDRHPALEASCFYAQGDGKVDLTKMPRGHFLQSAHSFFRFHQSFYL